MRRGSATEYAIVGSLVVLVLIAAIYTLSDRVFVLWAALAAAWGGFGG